MQHACHLYCHSSSCSSTVFQSLENSIIVIDDNNWKPFVIMPLNQHQRVSKQSTRKHRKPNPTASSLAKPLPKANRDKLRMSLPL